MWKAKLSNDSLVKARNNEKEYVDENIHENVISTGSTRYETYFLNVFFHRNCVFMANLITLSKLQRG